uniref:ORF69c n=1 Tax=Pinus koraiensis TaxID=88728 RepID=Q85X20_PINKO|nr:ORF69c [Pinus koraiensis]AAO74046.1 ORF69c [Pinus koraiensis]
MSDRYFDCTMDCLEHMIFERTLEFFEELAIKMKKKKEFIGVIIWYRINLDRSKILICLLWSNVPIHRSR